jgi:Domain of unknown function (DUF5018)
MKFKNYQITLLLTIITLFTACKEDQTVPKSSAKAITKLVFAQFTPAVQATIDETTKKITAVVPPTADVSKLIPSISVSLKAKVLPDSGKVQDFTNAVTYTVTAEDGTSANYQVTVSRTKFSVKDITEFSFADFSPAIVAKIDAATKTITATLPSTADLTKLKPTIKISDRATINPATGTVTDFSKAVNFTVTAEDASTQVYAVTITKEAPPVTTASLPVSISYIDNPVNVTNIKTITYTWVNGVLTKWVEKIGSGVVERVFNRDKDGLITSIDVNFNGSPRREEYTYSADKKTITFISAGSTYTWTYNDKKQLLSRSTKTNATGKVTSINLTWDAAKNRVTSVDDGDLLSTLNNYGDKANPLLEVYKQTQFLFVDDYNYNTTLLFLGDTVLNGWDFKYSFSSTTRSATSTISTDAKQRVSNIFVKQVTGGATAQNMDIVY